MPNIDTSKVFSIAQDMAKINSNFVNDFAMVENAIKKLKTDIQRPSEIREGIVSSFNELKENYFDEANKKRRELIDYLCNIVGKGYEDVEKTNKDLLEDAFEDVGVNGAVSDGGSQSSDAVVNNGNASVERMNNISLIRNVSGTNDPEFVKDGCIITSIANLYRRKIALENKDANSITRRTVLNANNGGVYMYWGSTSSKMSQSTGYAFSYNETGATNVTRINELLQTNPEGVMVYASGNGNHAIVITECDNGRYKVIDPIDGKIKYWEECYSVAKKGGTFYGWSIERFLGAANRTVYIPN